MSRRPTTRRYSRPIIPGSLQDLRRTNTRAFEALLDAQAAEAPADEIARLEAAYVAARDAIIAATR